MVIYERMAASEAAWASAAAAAALAAAPPAPEPSTSGDAALLAAYWDAAATSAAAPAPAAAPAAAAAVAAAALAAPALAPCASAAAAAGPGTGYAAAYSSATWYGWPAPGAPAAYGTPYGPPAGSCAPGSAAGSALVGKAPEEMSYAEAVLAALPPEDEAVQLAAAAAASGYSLDEYLQSSGYHAAYRNGGPKGGRTGEYGTVAVQDPRSRRLTAMAGVSADPVAQATSLYGEMRGWLDPASLERQLQAAAAARQKPLPPAVWKQLKARKQAMKAKTRSGSGT